MSQTGGKIALVVPGSTDYMLQGRCTVVRSKVYSGALSTLETGRSCSAIETARIAAKKSIQAFIITLKGFLKEMWIWTPWGPIRGSDIYSKFPRLPSPFKRKPIIWTNHFSFPNEMLRLISPKPRGSIEKWVISINDFSNRHAHNPNLGSARKWSCTARVFHSPQAPPVLPVLPASQWLCP